MNLRKAAQDQPCAICGVNGGTTVLCHYSGQRQHYFGKGRGIKGKDFYAVPLCHGCHQEGPFTEGWIAPGFEDQDMYAKAAAKSEEQLFYILQWHEKRLNNETNCR